MPLTKKIKYIGLPIGEWILIATTSVISILLAMKFGILGIIFGVLTLLIYYFYEILYNTIQKLLFQNRVVIE